MKLKNFSQVVPVLGLQWGDEGKGKGVARIANTLGKNDLIVRFQGGNNAGHTIYNAGKAYVFHLIPSAVFGHAQMHMGAGMVINPAALLQEAGGIPKNFSFLPRLSISPHAVLTMPTHLILDSISEEKKGKKKIGSTGKGISPAYTDLTARGSSSIAEAYRVGAYIEDLDIVDLKKEVKGVTHEDIRVVYEHLQRGSENHLRAFSRNIEIATGETYSPSFISKDAFEIILDTEAGMMGMGGRGDGFGQGMHDGGGRGREMGRW